MDRLLTRRRRRLDALGLAVAGAASLAGAVAVAAAPSCPAPLERATRLLLVTAPTMASPTGTAQLFAREGDGAWAADGSAMPVALGRAGMGWALDAAADIAAAGEPTKYEGDGRTPAGVFPAGAPFGRGGAGLADYLVLRTGTACVDDPGDPRYNTIADAADLPPGTSHEAMWTVPLYRQGLLVRTPTDRARKGGSCIFVHVWRGPGRPTVGCIAAAERNVTRIQHRFDREDAAVAIVPAAALPRFAGCLPGAEPARAH